MSMKSNAQPLYFSAYPLKAIQTATDAASTSPYLKAALKGAAGPAAPERARILSISNPNAVLDKTARIKTSNAIEPGENGWFGNYE